MSALAQVLNENTQPTNTKPLLDQIDLEAADLTEEEKQTLRTTIIEYADIFSMSETDLGYTDVLPFHIETGSAMPVCRRPYKIPYAVKDKVTAALKKMLDAKVIIPIHQQLGCTTGTCYQRKMAKYVSPQTFVASTR